MTIRSDATRLRVVTKDQRRPRSVVSRQGQVLLDTHFDQQARYQIDRVEIETRDTFGSPGRLVAPAATTGFRIQLPSIPNDIEIGAGQAYLDAWLLENPSTCRLSTQPHPRTGDAIAAPAAFCVKALVRHKDPTEETVLADIALGDAQTAGLSLIDWQVFPLALTVPGPGGAPPAGTCAGAASSDAWRLLREPSTGTLAVVRSSAPPASNPCSLMPSGGYSRCENLLFRIEVDDGDAKPGYPTVDGPRFGLHNLKIKLSRCNASMMAAVKQVSGTRIRVMPPSLDPRNWFAKGQFAEIVSLHDDVDPRAALSTTAGTRNNRLFRIAAASDDTIELDGDAQQIARTGVSDNGEWFLRLWDAFPEGNGVAAVSAPAGAAESQVIDAGDGVGLKLGGGAGATFRRGDFWTCAFRADGSNDWPMAGGIPEPMKPHGPETRYAILATLASTATGPKLEDCRVPLPTLTDRSLLYRGGDGQSVFALAGSAATPLPVRLRVAVMRGETPVSGAIVYWSAVGTAPAGQINGAIIGQPVATQTDPKGLAEVVWSLDNSRLLETFKVQASLDAPAATATGSPPVLFTATFDTAAHTGYSPGACKALAEVDNVQDALDTLCGLVGGRRTLGLKSIDLLGSQSTEQLIQSDLLLNGLEVPHNAFMKGIRFVFDNGPLRMSPKAYDPIAEIEIDLPYPATDPDREYWLAASARDLPKYPGVTGPFGFQRVRLDGGLKFGEGEIYWYPSEQARRFLETAPLHQWGQRILTSKLDGWKPEPPIERVLVRIRLRSALIWVDDKETGQRLYLNAEHLGEKGSFTGRELMRSERDPQRAGDLDMFIYLLTPKPIGRAPRAPRKPR